MVAAEDSLDGLVPAGLTWAMLHAELQASYERGFAAGVARERADREAGAEGDPRSLRCLCH